MTEPDPPPRSPLPPRIEHIVAIASAAGAGPRRRLTVAAFFLTTFAGAHLARLGTPIARGSAASLFAVWLVVVIVLAVRRRRATRSLADVLERVVAPAEPELAARALRAVRLAARTSIDPSAGSVELAELHLRRLVASVSIDAVRDAAERRGGRVHALALGSAALTLVAVIAGPLRVVEGLDVLVARGGIAPLPLVYLDEPEIVAHPPDYLHAKDITRLGFPAVDLPYGSLVTVHGVPARSGRRLFLTDGSVDVPFVDDGNGGVTARWPLTTSVELRVAARFGSVRIEQGETISARSIPDASPIVHVDDAPRVVKLLETNDIPVLYDATDDHGLREVDLVLRAGTTEERRVLAKLDGETTHDQGGYQLRATDRFVKKSFLPVEVTVEARDNDPLTGPKWGKSALIMLLPPAIGEVEALRYDALVAAEGALVHFLAFRMATPPPKDASARAAWAAGERDAQSGVDTALSSALSGTYGSLTFSKRAIALGLGQLAKEKAALEALLRSPSDDAQKKSVAAIEDAVLAIDGLARGMATRDAQRTAKRLSKVATEAADGFNQARTTEKRDQGLQRADAAIGVIGPSGKALARLGVLGADLGGIVANDLKREDRAKQVPDLFHAELVCRDLAARLANPVPSFAGGNGGGKGGGEGGGGEPDPADESSSDAEEDMDAGSRAIDELAGDHAGNIESVEQAISDAQKGDDVDELRDELKKHAEAIREAVRHLPRTGGDPDSSSGPASSGRDEALQMADALERGAAADAVQAGKSAMRSLEDASKDEGKDDIFDTADRDARNAKEAKGALGPEVKWAEDALDKLKKKTEQRAATGPAKGREKQLAERAAELAEKGATRSGAMSPEMLEHLRAAEEKMRDAAKQLGQGDVDKALDAQREAQRRLEMARSAKEEQKDDGESAGDGDKEGKMPGSGDLPIPGADEHKGPDELRRRVLEGLAGPGTQRLKPAVKRYAEKLLQ